MTKTSALLKAGKAMEKSESIVNFQQICGCRYLYIHINAFKWSRGLISAMTVKTYRCKTKE
jgi:hypothetical protein